MEPALTRLGAAGRPSGVVLMLHGGRASSSAAVDGRSASWRRSAPMQRHVAPALHEAGLAELRDMGRRGHYMLSGVAAWNEAAVSGTLQVVAAAGRQAG